MSDKDNKNKEINEFLNKSYEYGFTTEIESETIPPGLDEEVVTLISKKKMRKRRYNPSAVSFGFLRRLFVLLS